MKNKLARSTLIITFSEIIYSISAYIISAVLGRVLGPADYGRLGIIVTLTTMTIVLIGQSVPMAMSKYLSEIFEKNKKLVPIIKKQTIKIQIIIVGSVTILFFLLAPIIARLLNDASLTNLFRLSSLVIPTFAMASFYFYYYTGLHKFKIQAFLKTNRGLARMLFIIGLTLLLAPFGMALKGSIVGYIVAPFTVFLIAYGIDKFKISKEFKPSLKNDTKVFFDWHKLIKFAWPVTIFLIAYQFLNTIDLYLVKGIMHSDVQTGFYNAAYTVGTIPFNLFYALAVVLLPFISKTTSAGNKAETKKNISQSLRFLVMFLTPVCLLISYFSLPVINMFYSSRYALSAPVLSIYVIAEGFLTIFYILTFILNGAGKVKIPMYVAIIGFFLNTFLTYFLIKAYGLIGAAGGTAFMAFIIMAFILIYVYKEFGYLFPAKSFVKIMSAGAIMYATSFFFSLNQWLFILWALLLFILYLILLYLFQEIKKEDLLFFKNILFKKI